VRTLCEPTKKTLKIAGKGNMGAFLTQGMTPAAFECFGGDGKKEEGGNIEKERKTSAKAVCTSGKMQLT